MDPIQMPGNLGQWIADNLAAFGYPGLATLLLIENLFPPIPSELILPLAGFLVGRGQMSFLPAVLVATGGSLLGRTYSTRSACGAAVRWSCATAGGCA